MEQQLPVRRPAVAGLFYPDSPDRMRAELARLIKDVVPKDKTLVPQACTFT